MFIFGRHATFLRTSEKPPDEGGGGGAPEGEVLTEAQITQVGQIVQRTVNSAVTSQLTRVLPKALEEATKGLQDSIQEAIKKALPSEPPGGKHGEKDKDTNPLQKQVEALANDLENEKKARLEAENARIQAQRERQMDLGMNQFRAAISEKVKPELLDAAVELFGPKVLTLDDDGNVTLTVSRAPYKGAPLEKVQTTIDDGVEDFLKLESVKAFLPAPGGAQGKKPPIQPRIPVLRGGNGAGSDLPSDEEMAQHLAARGLI